MTLLQLIGIAFIAALLIVVVRSTQPLIAAAIALVTSLFIVGQLLGRIDTVVGSFEKFAAEAKVAPIYIQTLLKVLGVAYVTEIGAQLVRDTGQESIALKIELAGKIVILVLAVPMMSIVLETVLELLP